MTYKKKGPLDPEINTYNLPTREEFPKTHAEKASQERTIEALTKVVNEQKVEVSRLKEELATTKTYKEGLEAIANGLADDYHLACLGCRATEGVLHDHQVALRRLYTQQWKSIARLLQGDSYDSTATPHQFPKQDMDAMIKRTQKVCQERFLENRGKRE